jgi:hypothetical protein
MKKIVEVGNKHGNGDEFPDFVDRFYFCIKNVREIKKQRFPFALWLFDGRPLKLPTFLQNFVVGTVQTSN